MQKNIKEIIKTIPHKPGCYRYFDNKGRLIYIGKAKDLKKRVYSYFVGINDPKTTILVENIADIQWETTESEIEALVLESLLIKKFKPKFNIKVKDDKDFLWVKIDFNKTFPYPELVRKPEPEPRVKLFGPFTDNRLLKEGLTVLRKIFLWRDCSESKFSFYKKKGKPCLEYYIKNCNAPCLISDKQLSSKQVSNRNDYQLGIVQLVVFLQGGKKRLTGEFEKRMKAFSKKKEFEKAAIYRDKLKSLQHIDANMKMRKVEEDEKTKDLERFIDRINLDLGYNLEQKKDFRIEFYDISNISGREAVGSMIVWQGSFFKKSEYRKFRIKTVFGINDYKMMEEVLGRRIKNYEPASPAGRSGIKNEINHNSSFIIHYSKGDNQLKKVKDTSFSQEPDLIVLDGGKGQLGTIQRLFWEKNVNIPVVSLAKREEEVFGVKDGHFKKTNVRKNSPEGFFVQRLRDEAHRFAIGYHKNLRDKKIIRSRLDDIEGIGPITKKKLLLKFGSVEGIIRADIGEIAGVVGKKVAGRVKERL